MEQLETGFISVRCDRAGHAGQEEVLEDATTSGVKCLTDGQCPATLHPCLLLTVSVHARSVADTWITTAPRHPHHGIFQVKHLGCFLKAYFFSLEGNMFICSDSHMEQVRKHCPPQLAMGRGNIFFRMTIHISVSG